MSFFKSLFGGGGGDKDKRPERPAPLGLAIGLTYSIDTLRLRLAADALRFPIPDGEQIIVAQGSIPLADGMWVHRFYPEEGPILQVLADRMGESVAEVTWYMPVRSIYPANDREWAEWLGPKGHIGAPGFDFAEPDADGGPVTTHYDRVWMTDDPDQARRQVAPVEMNETVEEPDEPMRMIRQTAMLYARDVLGHDLAEYLLIAREEAAGDRSVELMLGVDVDPSAFKLI